jgi:phosphoglycolate phosphatase-like HAD superfamily hydrolase
VIRGHIVWDWNGTLLDDLPIVIEAVNSSIAALGEGPITADDYRDHYTRPVRHFYDRLFGRTISDDDWLRLNAGFHDSYFTLAEDVDLAPGALEAMAMIDRAGWTQSLLSMSPHDWLGRIVSRLGLTHRFDLIDGLAGSTGGLKARHLEVHLETLEVDGEATAVIGDTPDDVAAALHVGATPILFHGGSHHRDVLEEQGVPIAETLVEAVELVLGPSAD